MGGVSKQHDSDEDGVGYRKRSGLTEEETGQGRQRWNMLSVGDKSRQG